MLPAVVLLLGIAIGGCAGGDLLLWCTLTLRAPSARSRSAPRSGLLATASALGGRQAPLGLRFGIVLALGAGELRAGCGDHLTPQAEKR